MPKPISSRNRIVQKPVDSTWMKEMGACFDPQLNLHHLLNHLCIRDSKDILACKVNCAKLAYSKVSNKISQSSVSNKPCDVRNDCSPERPVRIFWAARRPYKWCVQYCAYIYISQALSHFPKRDFG